ncbi:oligosaccharide flippase family protein [Vibrio ordalii]|uniref:oligosaccharide flippase family protein n=1 Tax=Vibrio ordalii TaxID=28174 RepID=UPI0002F34D1C|nr:oligosaccharide flippase family protein [Vibrio ordalii]
MKLRENIIYLILMQFGNYIAPLLILPYLSRILGLDGFGIVAMSMSLCAIALIITDYGFGISAPYWLAKNKKDKRLVSQYIGAVFFVKFILFLLCSLGVFIFLNATDVIPFDKVTYVAIFLSILFQTFQPNWFFLGIEKMKNITIFMVTAKIIYLLLVFFYIKESTQSGMVLVCFAISNLFASSIGVYLIYKEGYWFSTPSRSEIWKVFKDGALFFISRLSVGVYTSANTFLVGIFSGAGGAALYNSAEKLYQAGLNATSPISQALYPYLARTGDKKVFYKFISLVFIPLFFIVLGCIAHAELIMVFIFGDEFRAGAKLLKIFMMIWLVSFVGVNFGYPAFASIGRVDIANKSVIFAAFLQLVSILTLYIFNMITAENVCLSVLAVETVVMLLRLVTFFKISRATQLN